MDAQISHLIAVSFKQFHATCCKNVNIFLHLRVLRFIKSSFVPLMMAK